MAVKYVDIEYLRAQNANAGQLILAGSGNTLTYTQHVAVDHNGNVGIGTSTPSATLHVNSIDNTRGLQLTVNDTIADQTFYGLNIDYTASGADAITANRNHTGLRISTNSTATGGTIANPHKIYGVANFITASGDSDLVEGIYNSVTSTVNAATTSMLYGTANLVNSAPAFGGTVSTALSAFNSVLAGGSGNTSSVIGTYSYVYNASNLSMNPSSMYGSWSAATVNNSTIGAYAPTTMYGSRASVTLSGNSGSTVSTAYGTSSSITHNTGNLTTGYLYYGSYSGSGISSNKWGLYITGEAKNYFSSNVSIGTTTPDALLTVSGVASFGDGTVTAPSIAHKGNLNTGMWFPATNTIAFSTNGVEDMRITSTGNIGIGTATASSPLTVQGNIQIQGSNSVLFFADGTSQSTSAVSAGTPGTIQFAGNDGKFSGDSTHLFWDTNNNRIGIGTSVTVATLQVKDTAIESTKTGPFTGTSAVVIDSFSATNVRSAHYFVQITDEDNSWYHISQITVLQDGVTAYKSEYNIVTNYIKLGTFDCAISAGQLQLTFTPYQSTNKTAKITRTSMTA